MLPSLSLPNWKGLRLPLFFTFALPVLTSATVFALAWFFPNALLFTAGAPLLSLASAYFYFPWATARKKFFQSHNLVKSVAVGLFTYEIYRQVLISIANGFGFSLTGLIHQKCGTNVDTPWLALGCGAAGTVTFIGLSILLWLLPAVLLESISSQPALPATQHSEA